MGNLSNTGCCLIASDVSGAGGEKHNKQNLLNYQSDLNPMKGVGALSPVNHKGLYQG